MKKFISRLLSVVKGLNLKEKLDNSQLTAEEQQEIVKAYNEANGENAWKEDYDDFVEERQQQQSAEHLSQTFKTLAGVAGLTEEAAETPEGVNKVLAAVKEMADGLKQANATIEKLANSAQDARPVGAAQAVSANGSHTASHAFGINHPLFAANKRHNKILINGSISGLARKDDKQVFMDDFENYAETLSARFNEVLRTGQLKNVKESKIDYSSLSSDAEIGTRQLTVRQDMLIARLVSLPSLSGIFDTVSNVQSGQVITNVLFTEISQAYQSGRVFKGNVTFQPEKAIVHKAMAKVQFEDMTALETAYLNYLNKEGSDSVKWTLIEWLILRIATQINNEKFTRAIIGYRVEPKKGESGHANFASTGVLHRLISLYEEHKFLPFKEKVLGNYDASDFGDVLIYFAKKIAARRGDFRNFVMYLNANHQPLFNEWFENKYGKNTNFAGVQSKVPNYDIPIVWVPNMGNLKFMFATIPGNIELLQNIAGEEFDTKFQRDLEEVIAFSYWMEGCGVGFAGPKYDSAAELEAAAGKEQMIFMNWPAIDVKQDETVVDVESEDLEDLGFLIRTGKNTSATVLSDIKNAKEGIVYRIECGDTDNATTIEKSGKFSEIKSGWTPQAKGDFIKVYLDAANDKFIELARS